MARKAEIYSRYSGIHWKPEYGAELEKIDRELSELRPLVEQEHQREKGGAEMHKQFMTAAEVAETMGVSLGKAYELIRGMNKELQDAGYLTVSGKFQSSSLRKKYFGFEAEPGAVATNNEKVGG